MTAPFGGHPNDQKRAVRAFFLSTRAKVGLAQVCLEAELHLIEQGCTPLTRSAQLKSVRDFWSKFRLENTTKRRWLVFWNSID